MPPLHSRPRRRERHSARLRGRVSPGATRRDHERQCDRRNAVVRQRM